MTERTEHRGMPQQTLQNPVKTIALAALPLYVTMIASSAGALVDTAVLGRHGTASLAALGVTLAIYSPATATVAGAMRGVMPFVAAKDDDPDALLPVVRDGMWLGVSTGLLGALAVGAVPLIGRVSGVPDTTLAQLGFLPALLACSVLVAAIGNSATSTLVGLGRSRLVMRAGLTGTATAVVLSIVLVGGVGSWNGLGAPGAGIAMLCSSAISATIAHWALRRSTILVGRRLGLGRPHARALLALARVGLPLAATVLIKFAVLGVLTFAAARVSSSTAAAHSISVSLVNVMFTAAVAIGQATIPLMSPYLKTRDVGGVRRGVTASLKVALMAVAVLGCVVFLFRSPAVSLFTHDPKPRDLVIGMIPLILVVVMTDALQAVLGFGLIAIKDTVPSLAVFAVCYGVLALVAVPVAAAGGLSALWTALACANALLCVGQAWFFRRRSGRLRDHALASA
ncbi:MATE family efflux transporter [Streptomyces sp. NPDC088253]|uniref:MATE family efflux transporter n=1 Tax=Streptomyces sp. NPDC088253 TaxID=3365846 RepID=UPI003813B96B